MSTVAKRSLILSAAAFVLVGFICFALLFLSGFIPPQVLSDSIRHNALEIEERGDYPIFFSETPKYRYDGFSDSLMLLQSIPDRNLTALENAVLGPYYALGIDTPGGSGTGGISPTMALLEKVADPSIENNRNYILYWHGYVVPLRVLLTVVSPMTIVTLNVFVFILLSVLVFEVFRRTGGLSYGIAFFVALLVTFSWIVPLGFKFFTCYLIAFIATLVLYWLLQDDTRREWIAPFFLTAGLLTAFFDLLTTPLLTFLLPLSLYLLWVIKRGLEKPFMRTLTAGASWLIGYAGFWATKWLLAAMVYGAEATNAEFVSTIAQRSGTEGVALTYRFGAIYNNLYQLAAIHPDGSIYMGEFFMLTGIALFIAAVIWGLLVKASSTDGEQVKQALPMLLVALGPYVWYFFVANHSTFHSWFTYRLQMMSLLAVVFFVLLSVNWTGLHNSNKQFDEG